MKTNISITYASAALLLSACTDSTFSVIPIEKDQQVLTRAFVSDNNPSETNPTLLSDWEHLEEVVLNSGGTVTLPWQSGAPSNLQVGFAYDIKRENGWILLFHTFKSLGLDNGQNYLFFYNELRGIIKVFYFKEGQIGTSNGFLWYLYQGSPSNSIFSEHSFFSKIGNERTAQSTTVTNQVQNPIDGLHGDSWNGFELEIPLSANYLNQFQISAYNNILTDYTFNGKSSSTTEGTVMQLSASQSGTWQAVANLSGEAAKSYINTYLADSTPTLRNTIKSAIRNLASSNYTSIIQAGVKYLFGSVLGWSSSGSSGQQLKLSTNGIMYITGRGSTPSIGNITPITITTPITDYYGGFLGLWDISARPVFTYERFSPFISKENGMWVATQYYETDGTVILPEAYISTYPSVIINPKVAPYITSQNVSYSMFCYTKADSLSFPLDIASEKMSSLERDVIINDSHLSLFQWTSYSGTSFDASGTMLPGYNFIDWGPESNSNFHVGLNITVELEFYYGGKQHSVISSRNYKCITREDPSMSNYSENPNYHMVPDALLHWHYN